MKNFTTYGKHQSQFSQLSKNIGCTPSRKEWRNILHLNLLPTDQLYQPCCMYRLDHAFFSLYCNGHIWNSLKLLDKKTSWLYFPKLSREYNNTCKGIFSQKIMTVLTVDKCDLLLSCHGYFEWAKMCHYRRKSTS